jgi:hypothetical protein
MKRIFIITIAATVLAGCSKLDEQLGSQLSENTSGSSGAVNATVILAGAYEAMRLPYQDQSRVWAAQEHTSDEVIGPTRATDWDDNGVWRVMHSQQWDPNHAFLADTYRDLGRIVFATSDILRFNPTPQEGAEGRMLRAMAMFSLVDGWDQVPYRENTGNPLEVPKVRKGTEALDFIISELNAIIPALPNGPANRCNKNGARALLMKAYLNKGVIANRGTPAFAAADMNQVITLANTIIAGPYSLTPNYYNNFAPANNSLSTENIWTAENIGGSSSGNVRSRWMCTLHYNQNPSGWNGFTTIADFYNKFSAGDVRRGADFPGQTNISGIKVGFLVGQQFDQNGVALKDRTGAPLAFTPQVKLTETGSNLEVTGIRVIKYPIDYVGGDNANNDFVYLRLADVMLMKAEAILRGGNDPNGQTPVQLTNMIRTRAAAPALASVSLDQLIDERGRELYWESWRRQDLIRFGKFLQPWNEKPQTDPKVLVFPIPARSLAANPNLVQNPGY